VEDRTLAELRARLHPMDALWADAMTVRYGPLLAVAGRTPFPPAAEEVE
jgi:hypothetical protein